MIFSHDIDHCFRETIGDGGLTRDRFAALVGEAGPAVDRLRRWHEDGGLPLLALPERRDDLRQIAGVADTYRDRYDDVVILGTGGSSLGGRSLYTLAEGPGATPGCPRLHFAENVDPHGFAALLAALDPAKTGFLVVSKSGGTAETLTQLLCALPWLFAAVGAEQAGTQVTAIVEPGDSVLRRLVAAHGFNALDHDPGVGGRFSVLSLVGLLPAMIAGLDAAAVRDGANAVLQPVLADDPKAPAAPVAGAALAVGLARACGAVQSVMFPYIDRLAPFALWYRQLWAESLGKQGQGTTPLRAMGTVDQHSQLQLYLDGPADKMFTVVMGPSAGTGPVIDPALCDDPGLAVYAGRRMGDLFDACQRATAETLAARGRPVRVLRLQAVDERTLGALMMHFMLETILAAHLLGVDPFDQPAVEESKVLARRYMAEAGGGDS
jgi:glucose-6-phosphate isomerase